MVIRNPPGANHQPATSNQQPLTAMLSATEISSALKQALADGEAMCVVSLMETDGRPATHVARLLVKDGGATAGGSLGDRALDEVAARHAVALMKDERQEIAVAHLKGLGGLVASPEGELRADDVQRRTDDARLLFEISRPPLELIICGGGHVGQAVAKAAALLNFKITVIERQARVLIAREISRSRRSPDHRRFYRSPAGAEDHTGFARGDRHARPQA